MIEIFRQIKGLHEADFSFNITMDGGETFHLDKEEYEQDTSWNLNDHVKITIEKER